MNFYPFIKYKWQSTYLAYFNVLHLFLFLFFLSRNNNKIFTFGSIISSFNINSTIPQRWSGQNVHMWALSLYCFSLSQHFSIWGSVAVWYIFLVMCGPVSQWVSTSLIMVFYASYLGLEVDNLLFWWCVVHNLHSLLSRTWGW